MRQSPETLCLAACARLSQPAHMPFPIGWGQTGAQSFLWLSSRHPTRGPPMTVNAWRPCRDQPLEAMEITRRAPGASMTQIEIAFCGVCHPTSTRCLRVAGARFTLRARPRDRRPRVGGGAHDGLQDRRARRRGLHRRQLPALRGLRRRPGELLRRHGRHHNSPIADAPGHTWAATRSASWCMSATCCASATPRPSLPRWRRCAAGITTWSPLRHWKVGPGQKVGIVGIGGLGHMVSSWHALGARVVAFTTSSPSVQLRSPSAPTRSWCHATRTR